MKNLGIRLKFRNNLGKMSKLLQSTVDSQLKNIICNFYEYLQNTQKILKFLQAQLDEFISLKSNDALRSLSINLQKLWSVEKYSNMMRQIYLYKLVVTPYMMEIVVQVLSEMIIKETAINNLKQNCINNFSKELKALYKSKYLIEMYQQQLNKLVSSNNGDENSQKVTLFDKVNLDKLNFLEIAVLFLEKIEQIQFQNKPSVLKKILNQRPNSCKYSNIWNQIIYQIKLQFKKKKKREAVIEAVIDALKELNLSNYDFYDEFINQHHQKQIEKQRKLGKSINIDRFLHDLKNIQLTLRKQ
ncbi:unnamed protein product [Paramecium pentaurelia]|uniref:Uncharacterized protein n=1 Tax=Paramecium pentaurelia TaxID=43138 RepID=A0A8S1UMD8_9CILI|nr:unnamed protein product [Paramecium pentaurelia]